MLSVLLLVPSINQCVIVLFVILLSSNHFGIHLNGHRTLSSSGYASQMYLQITFTYPSISSSLEMRRKQIIYPPISSQYICTFIFDQLVILVLLAFYLRTTRSH